MSKLPFCPCLEQVLLAVYQAMCQHDCSCVCSLNLACSDTSVGVTLQKSAVLALVITSQLLCFDIHTLQVHSAHRRNSPSSYCILHPVRLGTCLHMQRMDHASAWATFLVPCGCRLQVWKLDCRCCIYEIVNGCCRYVLNYTVTDSLGLSAVPLQLTVIIYESAQVQASLQLISQVPFTGDRAAARARAQLNIRQLTDASGSTANTAFRYFAGRLLS